MPDPPSQPEPKRSPYRPSDRTLRENQLATMKYEMETRVNKSQRVDTIVAAARSTIKAELWTKIVADVEGHATSLKEMQYSNTKPFEHGVTNLLNLISRSYVRWVCDTEGDKTPAVVFSGPDTRETLGDYLDACTKPDTSAFMATLWLLRQALACTATAPFTSRQEWTHQLGIGEWKPKDNRQGQVLWYLSALKRYRPDINTVYGIYIEKNTLRLMSHNACGTTESSAVDLDDVDSWIAFVVHLYRCHDSRDVRFEPVTATPDGRALWRIRTEAGASSTFRPFHAGPSPGRVTWLSFEQDDSTTPRACGFLKVSWQDAAAQYNEPDLLDVAHKDGWLPGLVRPRWTQRDESNFVCLDTPDGPPKRVKEMIHLASIGEPLSQCRSLLHLLKVVFDAIGVHDDLLSRDILHRDMSWFNILCNPWHDPETDEVKDVKEGVPCIDFILTGQKSVPCALVLDLDHAALMTQLYSEKHDPRKQKSGTPMFVAVELASAQSEEVVTTTPSLWNRLLAIDAYPDLVERAFSQKDAAFMGAFRRICNLESLRTNQPTTYDFVPIVSAGVPVGTNPSELHRPRHDIESIFWVLFWALLRASPLSAPPADQLSADALSEVGNILLDHRVGQETLRASLRKEPKRRALHPVLEKYGPLLQDLATYLAIPWHLYATTVPELPPNHAHIAFRRMLLVEIYELSANDAAADIFFNRAVPRSLRLPRSITQDRNTKPLRSPGTGSSPAFLSALPQSQSSALQRILSSSVAQGSGAMALARSTGESVSQRGSKRGPDSRDFDDAASDGQRLIKRSKRPAKPTPKVTVDALDVNRLINMFWDDRILWFGVGHRRKSEGDNSQHGHGSTRAQSDVPASIDETAATTS